MNALTGQHSLYGRVIGWGSLCPLKRLIFSSAVSNGLFQRYIIKFRFYSKLNLNLLTSYNIHRPSICMLHSMRIDWIPMELLVELCHLFWNWPSRTMPGPIKNTFILVHSNVLLFKHVEMHFMNEKLWVQTLSGTFLIS